MSDLNESERIVPIRTRGAFRASTEPADSETASPAIRTRGAVAPSATPGRPTPIPLETLLAERRKALHGLPVSVVTHRPECDSSSTFLAALVPCLHDSDALWLPPPAGAKAEAPTGHTGTVLLDPSRDTDRRTLQNLIVDFLYLPAHETEELEGESWERRARALIIDASGTRAQTLVAKARSRGLTVYTWTGQGVELQ